MRKLIAPSIGVTCAAALALPLTIPATTAASAAIPGASATAATAATSPGAVRAAGRPGAEPAVPGGTQSLPLVPLAADRSLGSSAVQGLPSKDVRPFSLVGVVWDDPDDELHGRVQVRTRAAGTGVWSGWQDLETHNAEHAPDPDATERAASRVRGATAPLWVGNSDGVEVRVAASTADGTGAPASATLPAGLRLELVDPGDPQESTPSAASAAGALGALGASFDPPLTAPLSPESVDAATPNADLAPLEATEIPELDRHQTEQDLLTLHAEGLEGVESPDDLDDLDDIDDIENLDEFDNLDGLPEEQRARPYIGPRPRIVTRRGWGADERLRERGFVYTKRIKAAFVHHTATGNNYSCSQAPSVIRGIYRYHVRSMGWRDIGYNFLVDKCGNLYEGRAGGVAKPVLGAHTSGFNSNTMGIAVLGTFNRTSPSTSTGRAIGRLTAWKLGLYGANPRAKTSLKSGGGNLYRKGKNVRLNVISGHRDAFVTDCPGQQLYRKLPKARWHAARFQGRF
ncbi:peptidoglycan recognition protein [Streptomyces sp. NPDC006610]|uniref:peptidoglycan recognition protein family protein n=1 Tax=Streptomyces sp. NPDC006610 TaxID=3154584 RepID=UPI0033B0BF30